MKLEIGRHCVKRRSAHVLRMTLPLIFPTLFLGTVTASSAQDLKMASTIPSRLEPIGTLARRFTGEVNKSTDGNVRIELFEPGAIVPVSETLDAVSAGIVDMGWSVPSYWAARDPAFNFFTTTMFRLTPEEHIEWMNREGTDELNRLYEEYNIVSLPCGMADSDGGGWYRKEIKNADDLAGLKIRMFGLGAQVLEKVGASSVLLPGAELNQALEVGVVDAVEFSLPSVDQGMGLYNAAKNYYFPSWHQPYTMYELLVNRDTWDGLSDSERGIIEKVCSASIQDGLQLTRQSNAKALQVLASEHGVSVRRFPQPVLDRLERAHEEVLQEISSASGNAKRIIDLQIEFKLEINIRTAPTPKTDEEEKNPPRQWSTTPLDTDYEVVSPAYLRSEPNLGVPTLQRLRSGTVVHVIERTIDPESGEVWLRLSTENGVFYSYSKNFRPLRPETGSKGGSVESGGAPARPLEIYNRKLAIVIGVSDYQHLQPQSDRPGDLIDLKYASKDAQAFADFLKNDPRAGGGWNVREFIGPRAVAGDIDDAIGEVLATSLPNDLIYIYFSGHGASKQYSPGHVYLMAYDTRPDRLHNGLYYPKLRAQIADATAKHVMFFVDACRSGIVGFGKGENTTPAFDQNELGKKANEFPDQKTIFSSGQSVQASWEDPDLEHGLFTYYLLKGLKGEAATAGTPGFIDLGEIVSFVIAKVSDHSRSNTDMAVQTPRLWSRSGIVNEQFPVALDQ